MELNEISEMIKLHGKSIYSFCRYLSKNKSDADDLYQEAFLKAIELRHKMDPQQNPKAFVISIAVGLNRNKRRKFAWRSKIAPLQSLNDQVDEDALRTNAETPENAAVSNELRLTIRSAIDTLPERQRLAIYMFYTAEMSIEDIASALRISQGTVKSRLHHARKSLKSILEGTLYEIC